MMEAIKALTVLEAEPYSVQLLRAGVAGGVSAARHRCCCVHRSSKVARVRHAPPSRPQEQARESDVILLYDTSERTADGLVVEDCVAIYKQQ
jgi:hypothetical protein